MMQLHGTTSAYIITLNGADREHLLIALELAIAVARREPEAKVLLADLKADALDALADRVFLVGASDRPREMAGSASTPRF